MCGARRVHRTAGRCRSASSSASTTRRRATEGKTGPLKENIANSQEEKRGKIGEAQDETLTGQTMNACGERKLAAALLRRSLPMGNSHLVRRRRSSGCRRR